MLFDFNQRWPCRWYLLLILSTHWGNNVWNSNNNSIMINGMHLLSLCTSNNKWSNIVPILLVVRYVRCITEREGSRLPTSAVNLLISSFQFFLGDNLGWVEVDHGVDLSISFSKDSSRGAAQSKRRGECGSGCKTEGKDSELHFGISMVVWMGFMFRGVF